MTLALHGKSRRRRTWLLFAALLAVVFGVSGSLMLTRDETKADSTTIVKAANLTAPIGGGWLFYDDITDTYNNAPGVLGDFASGPGTPPLGVGSASITIDGSGKTALATYQFGGTVLSNISELKFSAYNVSAPAPAYLNFNVDFDGTDTWQNRLVYVPPVVTPGTWETYDAYQGGAAMWTYSKPGFWPAPNNAVPNTTPLSWSTILSSYPGVRIRVSDPHVGIRVGHPGPAGTTYLDNFVIKISGDEKTFDFEPTIPCTTDCYVNDATGNDLNDGSLSTPKKTIGAGVSQVSAGGTVHVAAGTYTVGSTIDLNKAMTLLGTGTPVVQVSGSLPAFNLGTANVTVQGFKFQKTDKATQTILDVHASNLTINNNEFAGQYVFGDPDVSRAMVVWAGAFSGINITNNVIHDLRQPAYVSGTHTGTVSGNYTYRTRGWVLEGGNLTFTNNTWGVGANQNIFDIAILANVGPTYYTDVPAMSAVNHDAFIEDQRTVPFTLSIVYVSPSGSAANTGTAQSPKQTVQQGVDRVVVGGTIHVLPGTYHEDVLINKANVKLLGAGIDSAIVSGVSGGGSAALQVGAQSVVIDGFTITRDGNAVATWNDPLNSAGVAVQGQTNSVELRNSKLTGNRTGIDINNSNGNNIHNNIIDFNRTGMIFRNQTDNTVVKNNFITNNWTVGIVFLDAGCPSTCGVPTQSALGSSFIENSISGNWYGQVEDRQSSGANPAPGTTNTKSFTNNWWGTASPVVSTAEATEPGYSAQVPVAYGGGATAPGGQPDIKGTASANIVYQPYLCSGVDTSPVVGFQPAFGCGDIAIVAPTTANVGDTGINVQVVANNAVNLYGVQVYIAYDPQLALTGVVLGPGLNPAYVALNTASPGIVSFSYTQQAPGAPVSGSGIVLATLTFGAVSSGTANIGYQVGPTTLFSNDQGFPIGPNSLVTDSIVVSGPATTVTGTILLQGRSNHSGATAQIDPSGGPISGPTNSSGAFTITGVSVGAHPTLQAVMLGYLKAVKPFNVSAGSNPAGTVTLLGGDANMDNIINVLDLSFIAARFGQSGPVYSPVAPANTTPDINGDNVVNILDLSVTAANFAKVTQVWP